MDLMRQKFIGDALVAATAAYDGMNKPVLKTQARIAIASLPSKTETFKILNCNKADLVLALAMTAANNKKKGLLTALSVLESRVPAAPRGISILLSDEQITRHSDDQKDVNARASVHQLRKRLLDARIKANCTPVTPILLAGVK